MSLISKEVLEQLISGTKSIVQVASGQAAELSNEVINLFIINALLGVLQACSVFLVFYVVKRYCDFLAESSKKEDVKYFNAIKTTALIISIIFFASKSMPHLQLIAKAIVAPKILLIESTVELIKK